MLFRSDPTGIQPGANREPTGSQPLNPPHPPGRPPRAAELAQCLDSSPRRRPRALFSQPGSNRDPTGSQPGANWEPTAQPTASSWAASDFQFLRLLQRSHANYALVGVALVTSSALFPKKKRRPRHATTTIDGMNSQELHFKSLGIFNAF